MAMKDASNSAVTFLPVFPAEAGIALQRELLDAYEKAGHAWLTRARSEAELWSDLAAKLAASRSVPEALEAYTKGVSQQMQMTAEDGQRLLHDCQEITQKITEAVSNRRSTSST
jgi:hypothetical protein